MAPNLIKSSSQLSLDLSNHITFSLVDPAAVASVYPPLTDNEVLTREEGLQPRSIFSSPAKESRQSRQRSVLFNLMVKEEAHRAVSCDQIEANLVSDANAYQPYQHDASSSDQQEYYVNNNMEEEESYWDMPSDCDDVREDVHVLSTAQVERTLVEDALRRIEESKQSKTDVVNKHPHNAYWDWPSEPVLESEKKASLIASVLLEEAIREKLSIDNITRDEVSTQKTKTDSNAVPQMESSSSVTEDYWYWNTEEDSKDEIVAPHVHDPTHPNHAYWDMPSEPTSTEELKQKLIDKILTEERIRELLSSEATQEREVNFHRSRNDDTSADRTKDYCSAPECQLNSMPANYWDFNTSLENDLISMLSKEKQALINKILNEERLRYIVSMENIENHLVDDASKKSVEKVQQESSNFESPSVAASYWVW